MISERPAEVEDRAVPGHWEGDLLIGLERSAIGTLVERTHPVHDADPPAREDGYGTIRAHEERPGARRLRRDHDEERARRDDDHAARAAAPIADLGPRQGAVRARRSSRSRPASRSYFADPHSPWQRGTNENTNGLLRQYFPKGTDLSRWSADEIEAVAAALNSRPRKTLGWKTPAEAFDEHLRSLQQAGVATID